MSEKVLVIGLDCAPPALVFERFRPELPNISALIDGGIHGELKSCIPPITCPAWMCMLTGKDPGTLGVYGFRNRRDRSYEGLKIATADMITEPRVWDILGRAGKRVVLLGIPETYPPRPVNGCLVTSFLAPGTDSNYTYPPELKDEISAAVGEYIIDVRGFRTDDKERLLAEIVEMTEKRFKLARHLMRTKQWDFFMMVEMGPDRIHHGFWKYFDPGHPRHEPGNPYENTMLDYYRLLDERIGELVADAGPQTAVLVASDHGAKKLDGGVCLNQWLIREGYLHLKEQPAEITRPEKLGIDWDRTVAWGDGGYYGRLFINVKGREPRGVVDPADYEKTRDEIKQKLEALPDDKGNPMDTKIFRPEEIYQAVRGVPPDLIIIFGDLSWRSVGTVGYDSVYTQENDTGPDDANHDWNGIFIMRAPEVAKRGRAEGLEIRDVAPTILRLFGIEPPADMQGKSIVLGA